MLTQHSFLLHLIVLTPFDVEVSCDNIPSAEFADFIYFDNCSEPTLTYQEEIEAGNCPGNYDIIRLYELQDVCGNRSYHTWTIHVTDDIAPVFESAPTTLILDCSAPVPPLEITATDNCDGEITYTSTEETIQLECGFQLIGMWLPVNTHTHSH